MAETASVYCPDFKVQWDIEEAEDHLTEIISSRNGREQRRAVYPTAGYLRWVASSQYFTQEERRVLQAFMAARRGRFEAFYFFSPAPSNVSAAAAGALAWTGSTSFLILPWYIASFSQITSLKVNGVERVGEAWTLTQNYFGAPANDIRSQLTIPTNYNTQAVVITAQDVRERVIARFDLDRRATRFIQSGEHVSVFPIAVKQVI